jgi:hypothetical protein
MRELRAEVAQLHDAWSFGAQDVCLVSGVRVSTSTFLRRSGGGGGSLDCGKLVPDRALRRLFRVHAAVVPGQTLQKDTVGRFLMGTYTLKAVPSMLARTL